MDHGDINGFFGADRPAEGFEFELEAAEDIWSTSGDGDKPRTGVLSVVWLLE